MSGLSDLLQQMGNTPESSGRITLDAARAVEHLARLQLPGPDHYLLKLVQAAVASGASEVLCKVGWLAIEIAFVPQQPLETRQLFANLLDGRQPALRSLAVGVNAALGRVRTVSLEQDGRCQVFAHSGCWEEAAPPGQGFRIRITRSRWNCTPELELLKEHCRWSPVPVRVNGRSLQIPSWGNERTQVQAYVPGRALSAPGASRAVRPPRIAPALAGARILCDMALALERFQGATLVFVQDGVVSCTRQVDLGIDGLWAIVGGEGLPTDLGGFELVDGPELAKRIERVRGEATRMVARTQRVP